MKNKILRIIKMLSFYSFLGILLQALLLNFLMAGTNNAQNVKSVKDVYLTIEFNESSLEETFKELESKTIFKFSYDHRDLRGNQKINLKAKNITLEEVLLQISKEASLKFRQVNTSIDVTKMDRKKGFASPVEVILQSRTITGKITDAEDNSGLPGVNILEKGTSNGTVTDMDGNFSLNVAENSVLLISSVGYISEEVSVSNLSVIDVSLHPDIQSLAEIVVVGYGTVKKVTLQDRFHLLSQNNLLRIPQLMPCNRCRAELQVCR